MDEVTSQGSISAMVRTICIGRLPTGEPGQERDVGAPPSNMAANCSILLVEDNPEDADLTLQALRSSHVQNPVVVARDGGEALDYLFATGTHADRDSPDLPELVLLGLRLPNVDGLEVLRRLRAEPRTRTLPVAILSGSREERDLAAGYLGGANGGLRKPVDIEEFAAVVRQLGLFWLVCHVRPVGQPVRPAPIPPVEVLVSHSRQPMVVP
jgi:two-component system, response regulator